MSSRHKTILAFDQVSLSYSHSRRFLHSEDIEVLDRISFELHSGQALGIIGRNGAGKSSLLRLMAGVIEPDSGTIQRAPGLRISLLTLQLGFQHQLTGRENALLGCLLMGLSRKQAEKLLPEIIGFSGLSAAIEDPLTSYSSGMRARLGFSVAFFTRADVMLIDEVLGVGDYEFKMKSQAALLSATASDHTAVLVSHDEHFLAEVCDSLLWLENGRLVMHGLPELVLKKYHDYDHFVAMFAHEMGLTVEAVRRDPENRDPMKTIKRVVESVRDYWDHELGRSEAGTSTVRKFHPGRFPALSQVVHQQCGSSQWIENTKLVVEADKKTIETLFRRYENLLLALAKSQKTDLRMVRGTRLAQDVMALALNIKGASGFNVGAPGLPAPGSVHARGPDTAPLRRRHS